jgi:hypothetical protein
VGYWGDFVLARSDRPLAELPPFLARPGCSDEDEDCLHMCAERSGGWQTAQVCHFLPGGNYGWWLGELAGVTGFPVMIGSVADSGTCQVRGLAPSGDGWETFLAPERAAEEGLLDDDEDADDEGEDAAQRLLDAVPGTADQIARWAAEAGFRADAERIRRILVREADPFVEDIFFELIDACGLPELISDDQ